MTYIEEFIKDREQLTIAIDKLVNVFLDKYHPFIESTIQVRFTPAAYWSVYTHVKTTIHPSLIEKIVISETN